MKPAVFFLCFLFFLPAVLGAQVPGKLFTPKPSWSLQVPQAVEPGKTWDLQVTVTLPPGYYQDAHSEFFHLEVSPPLEKKTLTLPQPSAREGKESFTGRFTARVQVALPADTPPGSFTGEVRLGYQICQVDGICLLPSELKESFTTQVVAVPQRLDLASLGFNLLLALAGGFLLNLMPCVFPVLSLKALQVLKAPSPRRFRQETGVFTLGILSAFLAMALLVVVLKLGGGVPTWGFYFQSPPFVWGLALVFWVGALALWGLVSVPGLSLTTGISPRSGLLFAYIGGLVEVLAAAPCTAPLLGPALGYAFTLPPAGVVFFFLAAGLGLALPQILLAVFPRWGRKLPKAGPWLGHFEKLMGFFLAATVVYLLIILHALAGAPVLFQALGALLVSAVFFWAYALVPAPRHPGRKRVAGVLVFMGLLGAGAFLTFSPQATPELAQDLPAGWQKFSPEVLNQSLAEGKSVFVDATAAWCATCQVNEALVLSRADVAQAFDQGGVVKLRADYTRPDPAIARWLESVDRAGLPVYALYRPGKAVYLFPELLDAENLKREILRKP